MSRLSPAQKLTSSRIAGSTFSASARIVASTGMSSGQLSRTPPADQRPISAANTATAPVAITT